MLVGTPGGSGFCFERLVVDLWDTLWPMWHAANTHAGCAQEAHNARPVQVWLLLYAGCCAVFAV